MNSDISRLRLISILEGISYLLLLTVAMPLKYVFGFAIAVRIVGMAHGFLCLVLILSIIKAQISYKWNPRVSLMVFLASLVPLGAFWMDTKLKKLNYN